MPSNLFFRTAQNTSQAITESDFWIDWLSRGWDKFLSDPSLYIPGLLSGITATLITIFFLALFKKIVYKSASFLWKILSIIGSMKGFRWLVIKAYLNNIQKEFGTLTNIYLDREETLDLRRVFVPLTLRSRDHENSSTGAPLKTREILTNESQRRLVILGSPGSGKSTLLKALASGVSRQQWVEFRKSVPVLISLRDFSQQEDHPPLKQWLSERVLPSLGMRNAEFTLIKLMENR